MIQQLRTQLLKEIEQYEENGTKGFLLERITNFVGVSI